MIDSYILELLKAHSIDIENCRAQTYDGASAMASEVKGRSAYIEGQQPMAEKLKSKFITSPPGKLSQAVAPEIWLVIH